MEELRKAILAELKITKFDEKLLNGRTPFMKKYSRLNNLVDFLNLVYEIQDESKLQDILSELQKLNEEHQLDEIKDIDLEKELKDEYTLEYNATATKYGNLSDEELENIEGIETSYQYGKRFILLNGAPFRFTGRSIRGNGINVLTDPNFKEEKLGSLISNERINRWGRNSEFDVFDDLTQDNFVAFGGTDATRDLSEDEIISPEIFQNAITRSGRGSHTSIYFKGSRSASASLVPLEYAMDYDKNREENEKWIPYDTVYVLNSDVYAEQLEKRIKHGKSICTQDVVEDFSKSADPEILFDLLSSTYIPNEEKREFLTEEISNQEAVLDFCSKTEFSKCDNVDNLRYIKTIIDYLKEGKTINYQLVLELEKKCDDRLHELAGMKEISTSTLVEKINHELHEEKNIDSKAIMMEFIDDEIKKSKEKETFVVSDKNLEDYREEHLEQIENEKNEEQMQRDALAEQIEKYAENIRHRQNKVNGICDLLGMEKNGDDLSEVAYTISKMSQLCRSDDEKSAEARQIVVEKIINNSDFESSMDDWKRSQNEKFNKDLQTKIQLLIKDSEKQKIQEQIDSIDSQKIGVLGRIFGQKKYYDLLRYNLEFQKNNIDTSERNEKSIVDLMEYAKGNGMTQSVRDFLQKYHDCGIQIKEEDKENLENVLEQPVREKEVYPMPKVGIFGYRKKILEMNSYYGNPGNMTFDDSVVTLKKYQTKPIKQDLRSYVNRVWNDVSLALPQEEKQMNEDMNKEM